MESISEYRSSERVTTFHGSRLPERAAPAGYAALIDAHALKVPVPRTLSAVGPRHKTYVQDGWHIYTPRHAPPASIEGHLTFGLKYEGLDLWSSKPWFRQPDRSRSRPWSEARRPAPMPDGAGFCTSGCSAKRQSAGCGELARTAALLLLKDSRSSFEIEGEHPPQERIQRWGASRRIPL